MSRVQSLVLPILLAATSAAWPATNLLTNSDFESPDAGTINCYQNSTAGGWTSFGAANNHGSCLVESTYSNGVLTWPVSHTGTQMMFINYLDDVGTGVLQNNISLVANTNYQLTFSLAGVGGDPGAPNVDVTLSNGIGTHHYAVAAGASWSDFTWNFKALSTGSTTLTFTATSGPVVIDSLSLATAVPEPSSTAMLLAGLAMLGGVVARGRRSLTD